MASVITKNIELCSKLLKENQLVAIPTETVYGLAANAMDETAVSKIFEAKGRPRFNPLIVHIHDTSQMQELTSAIPKNALKLAEAFWPGSLTLVLPKSTNVPEIITAGKETVGIRMPNHPLTLELLRKLPFPLAAPSANPFTRISPTSAMHVESYFKDSLPAILDGGPCQVGLESTIVGFDEEQPIIYRKGGIAVEAIEAVVGKVKMLTENETAPQAPGMLLKHYSPRKPLIVSSTIAKVLKNNTDKKVGVISFYSDDFKQAEITKILSPSKDLNEAAKHLFSALHEMDMSNVDLIIAELFPEEGLGKSINDRLYRAQQ